LSENEPLVLIAKLLLNKKVYFKTINTRETEDERLVSPSFGDLQSEKGDKEKSQWGRPCVQTYFFRYMLRRSKFSVSPLIVKSNLTYLIEGKGGQPPFPFQSLIYTYVSVPEITG